MDKRFPFVDWFRNSSPYINAHRGRTFVILIEGEAMARGRGEQLIQDLALLHTLGVRLVVVFGIRPQVRQALDAAGITPGQHQGRWVADGEVMACIERVAAEQLLWLEARFSLGLPNTPMHGVELSAISGNLVMAKPLGVREGVDFDHSGEVRRVRTQAIEGLLEQGALVVLPPLGFSSTGEVFDLDASDVAQHAAMALSADKLILLGEASGLCDASGQLQRQLTPAEAGPLLNQATPGSELARHLEAACQAARHGVARTHLLSWHDHDALLGELFTRDGVGTMITRHRYEQLRSAELADIGGLLELLEPLEQRRMLVPRSRERLEHEIDDYLVIERDGMIIGCAALHRFDDAEMGELACVAVHDDYRGGARGELLLAELERRARRQGLSALFALSTHTTHWFFEHGFRLADLEALPPLRRDTYNHARKSKVLVKSLG
ncbi:MULTISPECIES: amino-acid N-acetyltransferase [unclassified Halomonas]|uniref:amino-acid N-acetyltransferase n=1 Tax=unclassified Halomonas TaxID=2609666 RepID=UPI00288463DC|nr:MULTISPECIES: amino-acid N-acetyltransferase [unclassified Halomonas]MDT0501807.1 amino-acid N-acetyltransferase [Halomonas sp. PAR7]MDT0511889.1 amino-acid N-acetyltransferase [Halomonas sp. LES1]MDT0592923.1 amino-acid N-acetyltransferase [Halomonas sp. PAR8]